MILLLNDAAELLEACINISSIEHTTSEHTSIKH